ESYDAGKNYRFVTNLPVTQFYRVNVDNTLPFYWVYGGTQDNNSLGGPSRNLSSQGVSSYDWIVTLGGDGFFQAIETDNPDIVYSAYQYGNISRFDKKSGERLNIKPQPRKGEDTYKWNWNTPFFISPHSQTRLYIGANKLFRSDDRGNSWKVISEDLTRQKDRNSWPVMDRYWGVDAVVKDVSTSLFGTMVSLAESPVKEDLLYVGMDDGMIQVTEDAGDNWRKILSITGVPEYTYVSDIFPSRYDENIVFATFDNHKRDDFKPYVMKSSDKGDTWTSIIGNLPEKGSVHTIEQDHVNPDLLFVGTEFGVFFSTDGGKIWTQLKSGIPTIAVKDMVIQERENDLVLATFGRGFYILDDYTPLRTISKEILEKDAHIFPIKDALMYVQNRGYYGQGGTYFTSKNPPFGATITYYIKDVPKTLKQERQSKEKELVKDKKPIPIPTMDELRAEEDEIAPYLVFTILDEDNNVVRKLTKKPSKGINRMIWNLRYASTRPVRVRDDKFNPLSGGGDGMFAMPGKYFVTISQYYRDSIKLLAGPQELHAVVLQNTTLPAEDRAELVAFQNKVADLSRAVYGAKNATDDLMKQIQTIKQAIQQSPDLPGELLFKATQVEEELDEILWKFNGQQPEASREENWPALPSINVRMRSLAYSHWSSTSAITQTQMDTYEIIADEFPPILEQLKRIKNIDLKALEDELDAAGAPWTPGRIPEWERR
ncbi:MAG: glycosyl hydrolase, partial [Bacteroidota bacterium]|nr:glycosyl hydrolase [Bacteroidota bacterium]